MMWEPEHNRLDAGEQPMLELGHDRLDVYRTRVIM